MIGASSRKMYLIVSSGIVFFCWMISMSNSGGRATTSMAGSTGAPCDNNMACGVLCHTDNSFGITTQEFDLIDPDADTSVNEYIPGKLYNAQVRVISGVGTGLYGFQATVLDTAYKNAGTWLNPGTNIQIASAPDCLDNIRTYIEHESPHLFSTFTMDWRAPSCNIGPITFYFAGNKVNNNGDLTGDSGGLGDSMRYEPSSLDHLILDQDPITGGYYWADRSIVLSGAVRMPDSVFLNTRDSIVMNFPFEVEHEALLEAQIDDCN